MNLEDIKILLVDDEPDILEIISYSLKNAGYNVYTAKNGIQAVMQAEKVEPHLIILDVMMPEMDGIEACEIIRKTAKIKHTLITFFEIIVKLIYIYIWLSMSFNYMYIYFPKSVKICVNIWSFTAIYVK